MNSNLVLTKEEDGRLVLASDAMDYGTSFKAYIEGLYRKKLKLDVYRTVLLVATGSGIAGVFLFIRQLLADYYR